MAARAQGSHRGGRLGGGAMKLGLLFTQLIEQFAIAFRGILIFARLFKVTQFGTQPIFLIHDFY